MEKLCICLCLIQHATGTIAARELLLNGCNGIFRCGACLAPVSSSEGPTQALEGRVEVGVGNKGCWAWSLETGGKRLGPQMSGVGISSISPEATWSQPHVSRPQWAKQTDFLTTEPENGAQNKGQHSEKPHLPTAAGLHDLLWPPTQRHMTPSREGAGRRLRNLKDWTFTLKRLSHPKEII